MIEHEKNGVYVDEEIIRNSPSFSHKNFPKVAPRSKSLDSFTGHMEVKSQIRILLDSARARGNPFPHVLFSGGPGVGKTTFSEIIGNEMGVKVHVMNAGTIETLDSLARLLVGKVKQNDIVFLDEIHQLKREIQEGLFYAMEDWKLSIFNAGLNKQLLLDIFPFTLIGATTDPQDLAQPMRDRFRMHFHLRPYTLNEMVDIVKGMCNFQDIPKISWESILMLSKASRVTPRISGRLVATLKDFLVSKNFDGLVDFRVIQEYFHIFNIHPNGLSELDQKYLRIMFKKYGERSIGMSSLAMSIGESVKTLKTVIEPYLLLNDWIELTPRGRKLTKIGIELAKALG